jgi:hypothetical protein
MSADLLGMTVVDPTRMTAVISDCGLYRDELRRVWDETKPLLPVCMVNPSKADHRVNDPTIVTLIWFAKLWGYGGLLVVNLYSYRSSSIAEMMKAANPAGPGNTRYIEAALTYARHANVPMLAAWGNAGSFDNRDQWLCARARHHLVDLICLGKTKEGFPKHPLARGKHRIPRDQQPIKFRLAASEA